MLGEHVLEGLVDPASPLYARYTESERLRAFSLRAAVFKLKFAEHQFDSWYLDLEDGLIHLPHVEPVWHALPAKPAFADEHEIVHQLSDGTRLKLKVHLRQMFDAPRFTLLEVVPADTRAAAEIRRRLGR
jgi:hypothetical protein